MIKVIDLFSGAGGFSLGFDNNYFEITKAVEFDKSIAETYKNNHKNTYLYNCDISEVDNLKCFKENEADIIIGGPPCQGFSMAGSRIRKGFLEDERNYLFKHYFNIVRIVKPKIFIMENVKGMKSMEGGKIFDEIIRLFKDKSNFDGDKYTVYYKVVNSQDFGIPQKRERLIIIGVKNGNANIEKIWNDIYLKYNYSSNKPTIWDAIGDLCSPTENGEVNLNKELQSNYARDLSKNSKVTYNHNKSNHSKKTLERIKQIKVNENYTILKEEIKSIHSGSYGRMSKEGVSVTITTRFDTPSGGKFIHPTEDRTITPREAARIQSFPDHYKFYGSRSSVCKQIGNAVPPKLSQFLSLLSRRIIEIENI